MIYKSNYEAKMADFYSISYWNLVMFITIDSDGFKLQENLPQSVNSPGYDNIAAVNGASLPIVFHLLIVQVGWLYDIYRCILVL